MTLKNSAANAAECGQQHSQGGPIRWFISRPTKLEIMSNTQHPSREPRWAGEFLGLPETGPASAASYPRRIGAIFIDWFVASGLAMLIEPGNQWVVLAVFVVMHFASLWLFGTTLGKRVFRIQVVQVGGATIKLYQAAIRAVLLGLVIPVILIDRDGRGLHDKLAGTVQIHM